MQLLAYFRWLSGHCLVVALIDREQSAAALFFFMYYSSRELYRHLVFVMMLVAAAVRLCCMYQSNDADVQNSLQPIIVNEPLSHSGHLPPEPFALFSHVPLSFGLDKVIPLMRREMRASSSVLRDVRAPEGVL